MNGIIIFLLRTETNDSLRWFLFYNPTFGCLLFTSCCLKCPRNWRHSLGPTIFSKEFFRCRTGNDKTPKPCDVEASGSGWDEQLERPGEHERPWEGGTQVSFMTHCVVRDRFQNLIVLATGLCRAPRLKFARWADYRECFSEFLFFCATFTCDQQIRRKMKKNARPIFIILLLLPSSPIQTNRMIFHAIMLYSDVFVFMEISDCQVHVSSSRLTHYHLRSRTAITVSTAEYSCNDFEVFDLYLSDVRDAR